MLEKDLGTSGKTAGLWAATGGILLGGLAIGYKSLIGKFNNMDLLLASTELFIIGSIVGFIIGAFLGIIGKEVGWIRTFKRITLSSVYVAPLMAISWLASNWIALSRISLYTGKLLPIIGSSLGWAIALFIIYKTIGYTKVSVTNLITNGKNLIASLV